MKKRIVYDGTVVLLLLLLAGLVVYFFFFAEPVKSEELKEAATLSEEEVQRRANRVLDSMMSPYCPGLTISACPSPKAGELRVQIRDKVRKGEEPESIMESLRLEYGDKVEAAPSSERSGFLTWLVPGIFVLAGGAVIGRQLMGPKKVKVERT